LWPGLALAAAACAAPCSAQLAAGVVDHQTSFPALNQRFTGQDGQPHGRVLIQLTVEAGVFYFQTPGHLRAYSHRYRYTVRNLDFPGGDENVITRFAAAFCGAAPILDPAGVVAGVGDPSTWSASASANDSPA